MTPSPLNNRSTHLLRRPVEIHRWRYLRFWLSQLTLAACKLTGAASGGSGAALIRPVLGAWFAVCLPFLVGCNGNSGTNAPTNPSSATSDSAGNSESTRPLRVVVTIAMIGDLVRQLGGEQVQVETLMGEGIDPHLYKPTRGDVRAIVQSDIVFYCGLMLEGKMAETLSVVGRDKPVIAVGDQLPSDLWIGGGGAESAHHDPHVWMDVSLWQQTIDTLQQGLEKFPRIDKRRLQERADQLRSKLQQMHEYGKQVLGTIPAERRVLVTSHDAFSYFGRAYGLEVAGVQGISTESEAGLQRINQLVDLLVDRQIPAVFVESSVPQKSLESIVKGARARGWNVTLGGPLFSDAMGPANSETGTYLGMMQYNFETIATGLGGTVDPKLRPK
jgi:manganese/zinc/iron transport system substrate-binding protein